jgi:hypothetical protein
MGVRQTANRSSDIRSQATQSWPRHSQAPARAPAWQRIRPLRSCSQLVPDYRVAVTCPRLKVRWLLSNMRKLRCSSCGGMRIPIKPLLQSSRD